MKKCKVGIEKKEMIFSVPTTYLYIRLFGFWAVAQNFLLHRKVLSCVTKNTPVPIS